MDYSCPILVGVTGGIGSGKTTIVNGFEALGLPTYIADAQAKELMQNNKTLIKKIKETFGENSYKDGVLDTDFLAKIVFKNKESLKKLNSLVHPAVRLDFKNWVKRQTANIVIYESALIFEHNQHHIFDYIILVTAPLEQRIERVIKRNKTTRKEVLERIKNQLPDEKKVTKAQFIIKNHNNYDYMTRIKSIYDKILENI